MAAILQKGSTETNQCSANFVVYVEQRTKNEGHTDEYDEYLMHFWNQKQFTQQLMVFLWEEAVRK